MERICALLQQHLDHVEVAAGARQAQRRVVVVAGLAGVVGAARYQKLDRAQVTGASSLKE